ncbi:hypothetical protein GGF31_001897 [Allomyces arbusculus]|nr:hypothetical protein GGF31_001897 [Allomyces arbusculus]
MLVAVIFVWLALSAPHAANAQQAPDAILVPATMSGLSPDDCFPIPATSKACPNFRGALVHPNLAAFLASAVFQTRIDATAAFTPGTVPYALELPAPSAVVGARNGIGFDQAFNISVIANAPAIWQSLLGCALQWPAALAPPSTTTAPPPAAPTGPAIGDAWSMTAPTPASTLAQRDAPDLSLTVGTPSPVYHTTVMCALLVQYWRPLCGPSNPAPPQLCPATSRAYAASLSAVAPPPACVVTGLAALMNSTAPGTAIAPKTPLTANYNDGLAKVFAWLATVTAPSGAPCLAGETAEPMCGLPRTAACALGCASSACSAGGSVGGGGSAAPKAGTDAPGTSSAAAGSSGTVVAASLGGVAVLLAAVIGTFFLVRRRRQRGGSEGKRTSAAPFDEVEIGSASLARRATKASHVHVVLHAPTASTAPFVELDHTDSVAPPRASARTTASEPDASAATDTDSSAAVRAAMTHAADHLARPRVWPTAPRPAAIEEGEEEVPPPIARTLPREEVPETAALETTAPAEIPVKFRAYVGVPLVADASFMSRLPDEIDVMCGDTVVLDWAWEDAWAQGTNLTTGHDGTFPLAVISTIAGAGGTVTEQPITPTPASPFPLTDDRAASPSSSATPRPPPRPPREPSSMSGFTGTPSRTSSPALDRVVSVCTRRTASLRSVAGRCGTSAAASPTTARTAGTAWRHTGASGASTLEDEVGAGREAEEDEEDD